MRIWAWGGANCQQTSHYELHKLCRRRWEPPLPPPPPMQTRNIMSLVMWCIILLIMFALRKPHTTTIAAHFHNALNKSSRPCAESMDWSDINQTRCDHWINAGVSKDLNFGKVHACLSSKQLRPITIYNY